MQRSNLPGLLIAVIFTLTFASGSAYTQEYLLKNGDFTADPQGWKVSGKIEVKKVDDIPTLVVNNGNALQSVELKPDWKFLNLQVRMRCTGVAVGNAIWKTGRLTVWPARGQVTYGAL